MLAAGRSLAREIIILEVRRFDFEATFATLAEQQIQALVVSSFSYFNDHQNKIVELAARYRVPAIYPNRNFILKGGLMSYSLDGSTLVREVLAKYVVRILKGEKPADLPVQQPTRHQFVINRKTAKMFGIDIPRLLLAFATEVIE